VDPRFEALADLAVHGANVQPGQVVAVAATTGQEEAARAVAHAAYRRGARFVDVTYFDPWVKRERVLNADPETLAYVPPWYGERALALGEMDAARISFSGVVSPEAFADLDPGLSGRDQLPWLKETSQLIADKSTNWCGIVCPHPAWATLVYPDLTEDEAYEHLWRDLSHVLRLDEPDPAAAWRTRAGELKRSARALTERRFDAIELRGPGTELRIGVFASGTWEAADFTTRFGVQHLPNLPTEEVFTTPDPMRVDGYVTSTKPLVLRGATIIRGLRVRFEGGRAVEIDADENAEALRSRAATDDGASRLGELALVDGHGRIGPLGTVFYDTLVDENAASHIALGFGFPFAVGDEDRDRVNKSGTHIDFMIGSPELDVDGITRDGERVPVLRQGDWQI